MAMTMMRFSDLSKGQEQAGVPQEEGEQVHGDEVHI